MPMIIASVIVSAITAKIVATYYFKKVDGYVKEMCEMTNKNNEKTLSIVHKLQRNHDKRKEVRDNGKTSSPHCQSKSCRI